MSFTQSEKENGRSLAVLRDRRDVFMQEKSGRLMTAVYLVTNLFSEEEPLRQTLRQASTSLVSELTTPTQQCSVRRLSVLHGLIGRTVAMLEAAHAVALISEMNFSVLKQEFISLRGQVEALCLKDKGTLTLSHEQLEVTEQETQTAPPEAPQTAVAATPTKNVSKGHMSFRESNSRLHIQSKKSQQNDEAERRRRVIRALLQRRGNLGIKDIKDSLPEYSEKTIQRDLQALIADGSIEKRGKRRWSTYFLIS